MSIQCLPATTLAIGFRLLIYHSMYCTTSSDVPLPPVNIGYMRTSNSISIDWQPEYKDVCIYCFIVVSYEVEVLQDGRPTVWTNDTSITIEELVPNTTIAIVIRVVSGTVKSRSVQVMVTTLSEYLLQCTTIYCKHQIHTVFDSKCIWYCNNVLLFICSYKPCKYSSIQVFKYSSILF